MPETMTYVGELTITACWCGIKFAMPSDLMRWHRKDKANATYCPLGHAGYIRETESTRLQAQLDQANAEARWQQRRAADALHDAETERARTAAARAESNRTRKRLAGGACPCCNRSFTDLARHMNSKHADYVNAPDLPADIGRRTMVSAVTEVVNAAGEQLTAPQVFGRLVLAGRRDNEHSVKTSLYNAARLGYIQRVGRGRFAAKPTA